MQCKKSLLKLDFNLKISYDDSVRKFLPQLLLFVLSLIITSFVNITFASGPKYTMKQRFGVGMDQHNADGTGGRTINEFAWQELGIGWYFDWGAGGGPQPGLEYLGLVGGWGKGVVDASTCNYYKSITADKTKYPDNIDNMMWTVGNEIGFDDGRTATEYARDFISWYDCLKSINPTFKVGSGALISLYHKLPGTTCSKTPNVNGGIAYFKTYINILKNSNKVPDFITSHAYTHCRPVGDLTVSNFIDEIKEQRALMKELGLQNKDLILNEWTNYSNYYVINHLKQTVDYLVSAKDTNIGNPDDEYRLVQRWAWFLLNNWPGKTDWSYNELVNSNSLEKIKPLNDLGKEYRIKIAAAVISDVIPTQTPTPTATTIPTPTSIPAPTLTPTPTPTIIIPTSTPLPTITPKPLTATDYEIWKKDYAEGITTNLSDFNHDGLTSLLDFEVWRMTLFY